MVWVGGEPEDLEVHISNGLTGSLCDTMASASYPSSCSCDQPTLSSVSPSCCLQHNFLKHRTDHSNALQRSSGAPKFLAWHSRPLPIPNHLLGLPPNPIFSKSCGPLPQHSHTVTPLCCASCTLPAFSKHHATISGPPRAVLLSPPSRRREQSGFFPGMCPGFPELDGDSVSSRGRNIRCLLLPRVTPPSLKKRRKHLWDLLSSFGCLPAGLAEGWRPWVPLD